MPRAAGRVGDRRHLALGDQRAGRIARRIDDDRLGPRRDRIDDRRGLDREAVFHVRLHDHRRRVGQLDLIADARPERAVRDHLVARLVERHRGVVERLFGAGGDDDFLGLDLDAVVEAIALADGVAQLEHAGRRRVLREVRIERRMRGVLDVFGRGEVGLAGAQIDDVDALAAQTIGFGAHLQSRGHRHPAHARCEIHFAFCLLPFAFSRSCSSTIGGTRPVISPPSVNTSLISRELM